MKKSAWKQRGLFDQQNYIGKRTRTQQRFFDQRNYVEKSAWDQRGFFDKKIASKKVRGNNVDFSISEFTSKKYVEMTQKFVQICSLAYRLNIDVGSTWCGRW